MPAGSVTIRYSVYSRTVYSSAIHPMKQIRGLQDFVKSQPATITEFDETLVSRLIAKITVFDDHFTVDFKSGITIDIEA